MDPATLYLILALPGGAADLRPVSAYPTMASCREMAAIMNEQIKRRYECRAQVPPETHGSAG